MKLKFKQRAYQTDAVQAVVSCFAGQPKSCGFKYAIDPGRAAAGVELTAVPDAHLCCGSAGTYSILQPELSAMLRDGKLAALASGGPARILSANIGCPTHLAEASATPVEHWIEYLDRRQSGG